MSFSKNMPSIILKNPAWFPNTIRLLCALCFCTQLVAQNGAPILRTYTVKDYAARPQNYTVTQDVRGLMYFGNAESILEYDGNTWRKIYLSDSAACKFLMASPQGIIYVSAENQIGYLAPDSIGKLMYYPIKSNTTEMGNAYAISLFNSNAYFAFEKNLFRYTNNKITVCTKKDAGISTLQNLLYQPGWGLVSVNGDIATTIKLPPALASKEIKAIVSYQKQILLAATDQLWLYDGKEAKPWVTKADGYLRNNRVTDVKVLSNQSVAVSTIRGGLVIIDKNGKVENIINRGAGLPNETVYQLWIDKQGGMWTCTEEGISRAEILSPITTFGNSSGLKGVVNAVKNHENILYVGTSTGLYYLSTKSARAAFEPVQGIVANTWNMASIGRELYAATSGGMFIVKRDTAEAISYTAARSLAPSNFPNVKVYAGLVEGVGVVVRKPRTKTSGESLQFLLAGRNNYGLKNVSVMETDRKGRTWLLTDGGLQVLYYRSNKDSLPIIESMAYNTTLPRNINHLFRKSGEVVFSTDKGLYRFIDKANRFVLDSTLGKNWVQKPIQYLYQLPSKDAIFIVTQDGLSKGKLNKKTNEYEWEDLSYRQLRGVNINSIFNTGKDPIIWIGHERGLFRLDPTIRYEERKVEYNTLVRTVSVNRMVDDKLQTLTLFAGAFNKDKTIVPIQDENSLERSRLKNNFDKIRFDFAATSFDGETGSTVFQYRLVGSKKDGEWSKDWNGQSFVEYPNPGPGTYTFEVRSMTMGRELGKPTTYTFVVEPLWYETRGAITGFVFVGLLFVGGVSWAAVAYSTRAQRRKIEWLNREIKKATAEIERLLHNILPAEIAEQLKNKQKRDAEKELKRKNQLARLNPLKFAQLRGQAEEVKLIELAEDDDIIADDFTHASVLFTDFKGFTIVAEKLSPEQLIKELNACFLAFDEIVDRRGLEKIKTIGDAYMCAGGIPKEDPINHVKIILAAMDIQQFMHELGERKRSQNKPFWELRLGIHVGPLVAGVVGKKKFAYDIWGDTVNTASRMESSGEPGKINISGDTYHLIKDLFVCSYRGKIPAKNKGDIEMYFVEGIKPELCIDEAGREPNATFWELAQKTAVTYGQKTHLSG